MMPLIAVVAGFLFNGWQSRLEAQDAFEVKAAEIVMEPDTPAEA
ncbi:MAG: hypothetical protein ACRDJV_06350 [Actinomycetota bacterium]